MAEEKEMFFFIADISGYTNYMLTNQMEAEHGKLSITFLIKSLIKAIDSPIEISKLEGDAIFMYVRKKVRDPLWLSQHILDFFALFQKRVEELRLSTTCQCGACQNIGNLSIKIIGHFGKALIEKIGRFEELAGVDVIILHRLLKNHVPSHRYLLLTERAYQQMEMPATLTVSKREEVYEDVGTIPVYVFDPPLVPSDELMQKASWLQKKVHGYRMMGQAMLHKWGVKKPGTFKNLPK